MCKKDVIFFPAPAIARLLQLSMPCLLNVTQTNVSKGIVEYRIVKQSAKKPWMLTRQENLFRKNSVRYTWLTLNCGNLSACLLLEAICTFNALQFGLRRKFGNFLHNGVIKGPKSWWIAKSITKNL